MAALLPCLRFCQIIFSAKIGEYKPHPSFKKRLPLKTKRIVLFASGSGSNVENIVDYFKDKPNITIACVLSNRKDAHVLERCNRLNISALYFNRTAFSASDCVLDILTSLDPDLIVLAGFLWKIPEVIIHKFPNKIVNIHPALLPSYGGKGMYGMKVHEAVKNNGDTETGITIHYVNENYDQGAIILQVKTPILASDSPETIAKKVHELEYAHFPKAIAKLLKD
jgi:phosphoribosylglycinamide formyltransferase-1